MRSWTIVVAAAAASVLFVAAPVNAADQSGTGQAGVYGTSAPPSQASEPPAPSAAVASAAPISSPASLPATGSDVALTIQIGAAALATGLGFVAVSKQRSRKSLRPAV